MANEDRLNLKEMQLYVKGPLGEWTKQETVPATATHFKCRVLTDGEYWYSVVTVSLNGKVNPEDVTQAQPSLKVVVDTQPPLLAVHTWSGPDGETLLKCTMIDANPDPSSIRLICRTSVGGEILLDPIADQPGVFKIPGDVNPLRVTGKDLAQNETVQDVNFKQITAAAPQPFAPIVPTPANNSFNPHSPQFDPQSPIVSTPNINPLPGNPSVPNEIPVPPWGPPPVVTPASVGSSAVASVDNLPKIAVPPGPAPANRKILNTPQATIDYRIDSVGPSGIGKVEVYLTVDQGQTWKRLKEDFNKRSPVDIELPGEGLFGISVIVTNGNGFGGTPPQRGDQPSYWIEVDTTCPYVSLRPIDPNTASSGALEIRWTASDKNLASEPVSLFYRTRPDGVWQTIASGLKNDGLYRWAFPRGAGAQFFFKIEVVDQAGNVGHVETPNAIVLDMTEPRGIITNVTGGDHRVAGQGN